MALIRKPNAHDFAQALERAGRAFGVAAFALYPANSVFSDVFGHHLDADLATKAVVAGCTAGGAFLLRFVFPDWFRSKPTGLDIDPDGKTASHLTTDAATDA